MLYLRRFSLPGQGAEASFLARDSENKRTCYGSRYPFGIFLSRKVPPLTFEPITILCGGNGCGKTTVLNLMAVSYTHLDVYKRQVYDKPLIYYPIAILMQAGISEILVIVPPNETATFTALLGDGSQYGLKISYAEQPVPRGIADALLIGQEFVGDDRVCLVLGDNIFYAPTLGATLKKAAASPAAATVFGYYVEDPRPFGVVEFDKNGKAISIEEKQMCIRDRSGSGRQ